MIYFRIRKYGTTVDSSFFLKDGQGIADLSGFLRGDSVLVMFRVDAEKYNALECLDPRTIGKDLRISVDYPGDAMRFTAHIPCVVAERGHGIGWAAMGEMQYYGPTITFEAINGYAEDVLLWVILNEKPAWAEDGG